MPVRSSELGLVVHNLPYSWPRNEKGMRGLRTPETHLPSRQKVFITGHMEDKPGRVNSRLPQSEIGLVRYGLRQEMEEMYARHEGNIDLVLCSGTAGTDLLAVEWALEKIHATEAIGKRANIGVNIYLPYAEGDFLSEAVSYTGNAERWEEIFMEAKARGFVHEPYVQGQRDPLTREQVNDLNRKRGIREDAIAYQSYVDLNLFMLSQLSLSRDFIIAVWDGKGGDTPGGTQHGLSMYLKAIRDGGYEVPTPEDRRIRILNYGIQNTADLQTYGSYAKYLVPQPNLTSEQIERERTRWYSEIDQAKQRRNILGRGLSLFTFGRRNV